MRLIFQFLSLQFQNMKIIDIWTGPVLTLQHQINVLLLLGEPLKIWKGEILCGEGKLEPLRARRVGEYKEESSTRQCKEKQSSEDSSHTKSKDILRKISKSAGNVLDFFNRDTLSPRVSKGGRLSRSNSKKFKRSSSVPKNLLKENSGFDRELKLLQASRKVSLKQFTPEFIEGEIWDAVKHGYKGEKGFIARMTELYGARSTSSRNKISGVAQARVDGMIKDIQYDEGLLKFKEYVLNYFKLIQDVLENIPFKEKKYKTWKRDFLSVISLVVKEYSGESREGDEKIGLQQLLNRVQSEVGAMGPKEQEMIHSVFGGAKNFENMLANLDEQKLNPLIKTIHKNSKDLAEGTKNLENLNSYELKLKKNHDAKGQALWKQVNDSIKRSLFVDKQPLMEEFKINNKEIKIPEDKLQDEFSFYQFIIQELFRAGWERSRFKDKSEKYLEECAKEEAENLLADKKRIRAASVFPILRNFSVNTRLEDFELFRKRWPNINQFMSEESGQKKSRFLTRSSKKGSKRNLHSNEKTFQRSTYGQTVRAQPLPEEYLDCKMDAEGRDPVNIQILNDGRSFAIQRVYQIRLCPLIEGVKSHRRGDSYANITWVVTSEGKVSKDDMGIVKTEGVFTGTIAAIKFADTTSLEKRLEIIDRMTRDNKKHPENEQLASLYERSGNVPVRRSNSTIEPSEEEQTDTKEKKKVASRFRYGLNRKKSKEKCGLQMEG